MNFHDNRGMYEAIAQWLEKHDVEVDWEAVMQCKWWVGPKDWVPPPKWSVPPPFPQRLTPFSASKLLFAQWWHGLVIPAELGDPLEGTVELGQGESEQKFFSRAGEQHRWRIFLQQLAELTRIEIIELKLITPLDRQALVRYAWIEEELRERELEHNRARVLRQKQGRAQFNLSRRKEKWLRKRAQSGNLACIAEMERKGYGSPGEHRHWRELHARKVKEVEHMRVKKVELKEELNVAGLSGAEPETEASDPPRSVEERNHLGGIERELEVIRVGPNPRILTCRYLELASERNCRVRVKDSTKFVRGMKLKMIEPKDEEAFSEPWVYDGVLPRFKGRW